MSKYSAKITRKCLFLKVNYLPSLLSIISNVSTHLSKYSRISGDWGSVADYYFSERKECALTLGVSQSLYMTIFSDKVLKQKIL